MARKASWTWSDVAGAAPRLAKVQKLAKAGKIAKSEPQPDQHQPPAALEVLEIAQADRYLGIVMGNCVKLQSLIADRQRRAVGSATLPPSEA